ncbi:hypothetical protein GN109_01445 [Collimonas pratensis]|uniref:hypothetical protein n=1 Tax=Collimonas pratensis TaxID=279113 RepID=UPI00143CEF16|nr:hypothetical protein [Collimonas pratensis]NKI68069.1 hypothetical protein [Collimonas pratensis]
MLSPLEHILAWFSGLSPTQRQDSAFLISSAMPGVTFAPMNPSMVEDFIDQVRQLNTSEEKEYGLILSLSILVENLLISKRRDPDGWKETRAKLEKLGKDESSEKFLQMAVEIELRGAQWVASCKKWEAMAALYLTDKALASKYMIAS